MANCYTAITQGLEVIPVLNKMDLPQAEPEKVINEIENIIGIEADGPFVAAQRLAKASSKYSKNWYRKCHRLWVM